MRKGNISIFVPHIGCPCRCTFCDQRTISGQTAPPTPADVRAACEKAFEKDGFSYEIAFFGGSFTAIDPAYMQSLLAAAAPYVQAGKAKCLLLTSAGKNPALPETDALSAIGLEKAETVLWWGLIVPKDTPEVIFDTLQKAFTKAANSDRFKEAMAQQGGTLRVLDGKATDTLIRDELAALGEVAKSLGIQKKSQ